MRVTRMVVRLDAGRTRLRRASFIRFAATCTPAEIFERFDEGVVAFFAEPHLLEGAIEAEDLACQQNGDAEGVGFLHDEADVLLLQVDG